VRHPGYLGGWLAFLGLGLALGNGIALAVPAVLYRIDVEQRARRAAFAEYAAYAGKVRRSIPFVW